MSDNRMLQTVNALEAELKGLRKEKETFLKLLGGMQHLSFDSRDIVRDTITQEYDDKIKHRSDELAAIKSYLAELDGKHGEEK